MSDELKKFLSRELDELKQNKIRTIGLVVCVVVAVILWTVDDSSGGEEIVLDDAPPVTKDLPVKTLPVEKSPDGVTIVLGANADALLIADPFAGEEKPQPPPKPQPPLPTPPLPAIPSPVVIQPPPQIEQPREQIILTGTAQSGNNKTAMFLRGNETLFKTIGDELDGRRIVDITADFVTLDNNERIYLQRGLN